MNPKHVDEYVPPNQADVVTFGSDRIGVTNGLLLKFPQIHVVGDISLADRPRTSVSAVVPAAVAGTRCVKFTEDHFRMTPSLPEFDHYRPAAYFIEHTPSVLAKVASSAIDAAMDRFERLFVAVNALLPVQAVPSKLVAQGSAPTPQPTATA